MNRRKAAATAAVVCAGIAGAVVVFLGQHGSTHPAATTTTTEAIAPELTFQPTGTAAVGSLDPATTVRTATVTWKITGSCSASGSKFTCLINLTASNGLVSGGIVSVYPDAGKVPGCRAYGILAHDKVSISGECRVPLADKVLAVYTGSLDTKGVSPLATAHIPWSRP